ncbi:MAG: LysE family transporter [Pseudomonadota bacterium]
MIEFVAAVFFLLITPGPGVLTTAGVGAAYGMQQGLRYAAGIVLGAQLLMVLVASGLAAMIFALPYVREVLVAASASYLLYLALKIAVSGSRIAFIEGTSPRFVDGFVLSIINPKGYAVGTALFSGFPFWPESIVIENAIKVAVLFAIAVPVHLVWLAAGATLKRLALGARITRAINIGMAIAMVVVVALAVLSQLPDMANLF